MNFTVQCRIDHIWTSVFITQNLPILNIIHANTRQMPAWSNILSISLPSANEVCEVFVITLVCQSFWSRGGVRIWRCASGGGRSASKGVQWGLHFFAFAFYQCEQALLSHSRQWILLHTRCPTCHWRESPDVFRPRRWSKPCSPDLQQIWDLQ